MVSAAGRNPPRNSTTFPFWSSYSLPNGREFVEASALPAPAAISRFSVSGPWLRLRSDEQLVALFRSGSEDAFRAIHDRYRARLLAYARQMLGGSRQDAEDVLQDVFFRAYGALRADARPVALRAWLYRVAHNRCIDQIRRPAPAPSEVLEVSRPPQPDPPSETERREDLRRLVTDVGRLPDQQRSALLMRELQGLSYEELSDSLDVSVAAVKSLLVRARTGLVEAADARDTACGSVRHDLALACDRGVRASGLARRHLRDCAGCREYRDGLRGVRRRLSALVPVGPLGFLAKGLGIGGSGAAASSAAGGGATIGGIGSLATATKVAIVCAAAVTAGGAIEATRPSRPASHHAASRAAARAARAAAAAAAGTASARVVATRVSASPALTGGTPAPVDHHSASTRSARHHHSGSGPQFVTGQDILPPPQPTTATRTHDQPGVGGLTKIVTGTPSTSTTPGASTTGTTVGTTVGGTNWGSGSTAGSSTGSSSSGTSSGSWTPTATTSSGSSGAGSGTTSSGSSSGGSTSGSSSSGSTTTSDSGTTSSGSGWGTN